MNEPHNHVSADICDLSKRGVIADAIRDYCHSVSPAAVQDSHGTERIYYAGIDLYGLADAISAALVPDAAQPEKETDWFDECSKQVGKAFQYWTALERIAIVCTQNMDRDKNHRMALDGVRQIANDCLAASQPSPAATVETFDSDAVRSQLREGNRMAKEAFDARSSAGNEDAGCGAAVITPWAVEEHPVSQGLLRTQEIMRAETMKTKIAALAHRFWSIHPSSLDDMGLTREEFYASEMTKLLGERQPSAATEQEPAGWFCFVPSIYGADEPVHIRAWTTSADRAKRLGATIGRQLEPLYRAVPQGARDPAVVAYVQHAILAHPHFEGGPALAFGLANTTIDAFTSAVSRPQSRSGICVNCNYRASKHGRSAYATCGQFTPSEDK